MLNKLLKYDLKYMIRNMGIFYILAIFFSITTRIFFSLEETYMIKILGQISVGCMFSMVASILINTLMRSWIRFRDSIYKDEGYLTNTLPVTKNAIYNSKFIQTLMFFVVSFLIMIICLIITYYTKDRWLLLKDYINTITTGLEFNTVLFIINMLAVIFLEVFNAIQCGYLGIILGYQRNNSKIGFSVLFGFIAYLLSQGLVVVLMYIVGLFDKSIMSFFTNDIIVDSSSLKLLFLLAIILYMIIIVLMNLLCKRILNKGINIE